MKRICLLGGVVSVAFIGLAATTPPAPLNFHIGSPVIVSALQNQTVAVGQNATFSVLATGDGTLNYQWEVNGLVVGADANSYTRQNCQLTDNNDQVLVTVSNATGLVQSSAALLQVTSTGTNYFVSTSGLSSNTGLSTNSPWPLSYAVSRLGPGITVTLMPGVYTGPVDLTGVNGAPGSPAILRSQFKWQAVIANSTSGTGCGVIVGAGNGSYLTVDGLCVSNSLIDGVSVGTYSTIRNCWITGNGHQGINISSPACSNIVVEYNLIENNGTVAAGNPSINLYHGIYFGSQNNIIRGNVVRNDNCGFGIHLYTGYSGDWNNHNLIYNNLVYGHTNAYGVTLWSAVDGGSLPGTNYLFNNTILDGVALSYGTDYLSNNIILASQQNPTLPIVASSSRVPTVYADYNMSTTSLVPSGPRDVVTANPGFVNAANGLYWLTTNSPARFSASTNVVPPVDFFGIAQTSVTDLGAFQFNAKLAGDTRDLDPSPANPDYWLLP